VESDAAMTGSCRTGARTGARARAVLGARDLDRHRTPPGRSPERRHAPARAAPEGPLAGSNGALPDIPSLYRGAPGVSAAVARLLGLPLDAFAEAGEMLEVRVPRAPSTLWFVSDGRTAETLVGEGVSRGQVWTADELLDLLSIPSITAATVRTVTLAKLGVDGEVTALRSPGSS
jgi:hypothetical protein